MSIVKAVSRNILRRRLFLYDLHKSAAPCKAMPPNDTPLNFHHAIARDISAVFKAYETDEQSHGARIEVFDRLRRLVQAIGNDGEYELVDTSFGSLEGSPRLYNAPLECMIVDETRPEGLPPTYGSEPVPTAYDAIALAKYLSVNGYDGSFIDTKPDVLGYDAADGTALQKPAGLQPEPKWGELSSPFSSMFNVLPPTLRIRPKNAVHPEIHLSPVHPSHLLRWSLLRRTCESSAAFRMLSSLFWLWLRSQGTAHYSWTTVAFLSMYYLQAHYKIPTLPTSDTPPPPQVFWDRLDVGPKPQYERLVVPQVPLFAEPSNQLGQLLFSFFSFWGECRYVPYNRIFDPISGTHIRRKHKYKANGKDLNEAQVMKNLREQSEGAVKDAIWDFNPLVVVDPFLRYHNLAHTVTKHALQLMFYRARLAALTLKSGQPVTDIFGTGALPPFEAMDDQEASLSSQTSTLSLGLRRMYHTSARKARKPPPPEILPIPEVPQDVLVARSRTIRRVQVAIEEKYGNKYLVECFGSTQYGVDSPSSDLDLVVIDMDRMKGFSRDVDVDALPLVYSMRNLARTLERNGFNIVQVIPYANVPIVKFEDPRTRLSCDINVNDQLGLFNTKLVAQYCALSPLLRPLLVMIKKWAKTSGLNDASGEHGTATFSSYALTLMTIGFMQAHDLLPNLQAGLPPLPANDGFWLRGKGGERTRCDPRFDSAPSWTPPADALNYDLRQALCAWFRYWGHQHNYALDMMSIRNGGIIPRSEKAGATVTAEKQGKKRAKAKLTASKREREREAKAKRSSPGGAGPSTPLEGVSDIALEGEEEVGEIRGDVSLAVDDPDESALEEMDKIDVEHGKQPRTWALAALVVADPFILSKNAAGSITVRAIERFTAECRRSLLLLSSDADFEDLLGNGSAIGLLGSSRRYPRRGKRERGKVPFRGHDRWDKANENQGLREVARGRDMRGARDDAARDRHRSPSQSHSRIRTQRDESYAAPSQYNSQSQGAQRGTSKGRERGGVGSTAASKPRNDNGEGERGRTNAEVGFGVRTREGTQSRGTGQGSQPRESEISSNRGARGGYKITGRWGRRGIRVRKAAASSGA